VRLGGLNKLITFNLIFGYRIRDLPVCSIVPQPQGYLAPILCARVSHTCYVYYLDSLHSAQEEFSYPDNYPHFHSRGHNFLSNRSWATKPKAIENAVIIASIVPPLSKETAMPR
jgi:hypothetical protein